MMCRYRKKNEIGMTSLAREITQLILEDCIAGLWLVVVGYRAVDITHCTS